MRGLFSKAAAAVLISALGCARAEGPRPAPPTAPAPVPAPSGPAPTSEPAPKASAPSTLDPSEEITPEELATIPEPVPGSRDVRPELRGESPLAPSTPPPSSQQPSPTLSSGAREPESAAWVWRVQVFASADRAEAERAGESATSRLGEPHMIVLEGGLYKVRLGAMTTEAEAQALRDRAVRDGFPGAFRVRTAR